MTGRDQLSLFERSTTRSPSAGTSSARSKEHATSSPARATSEITAATSTTPTRPAREQLLRDGAASAGSSSGDVTNTAASVQRRQLPIFTARSTDPMFAIPRPITRGDCRNEARPCPWVGCRHHLLLEVALGEGERKRAKSLRLNRRNSTGGRRAGLRSSAAEQLVRAWIDDALELLTRMRYTCALDVVEAFPDGLSRLGASRRY